MLLNESCYVTGGSFKYGVNLVERNNQVIFPALDLVRDFPMFAVISYSMWVQGNKADLRIHNKLIFKFYFPMWAHLSPQIKSFITPLLMTHQLVLQRGILKTQIWKCGPCVISLLDTYQLIGHLPSSNSKYELQFYITKGQKLLLVISPNQVFFLSSSQKESTKQNQKTAKPMVLL